MTIISTLSDLQKFATNFTAGLRSGDTLILTGPLGAGKTTLTQFIGSELGITEPITSPTFTYMIEYILPKKIRGIARLVHIDMYRLTPHQAEAKGILDYIGDRDAVTVIEWGEKLGRALPEGTKKVGIEMDGEERRVEVK